MNRVSILCLGVKDITASLRFYRDGLGFETTEKGDTPQVVFFNSRGVKLELYPLRLLAEDIDPAAPPVTPGGFGGITLAYNVASPAEVRAVVEMARRAGAKIVKEPQSVFWGGYHAYFADPDGYYWEVAHNPGWQMDENGEIKF
ncbi:MAG: VOC family protein [Eubacteriales bacterium]|nr:VOC family protein [Eubacteriales bacterium]